jgi:rhodanese-related sulfurtransferase
MTMSARLLEFSFKHIELISATFATLCTLGVIEYLQWAWSSRGISPTRVTLLMNRYNAKVLDLREESEFLKAHIPEAIHIKTHSKEVYLEKLGALQPIILITTKAVPPLQLLRQLKAAGYSELYHLQGGIKAWEDSHLPMIRTLLKN